MSACSSSRKTTECWSCQGRLWSLVFVTLRVNQPSSSSPCVGKRTWSWFGTVRLCAVFGQQWKTSGVLATWDTSKRYVYLRCVMRTHSYENSIAITWKKKSVYARRIGILGSEQNVHFAICFVHHITDKSVQVPLSWCIQNLKDWPFYLLLGFTDVSLFFVMLIQVIWSLGRNWYLFQLQSAWHARRDWEKIKIGECLPPYCIYWVSEKVKRNVHITIFVPVLLTRMGEKHDLSREGKNVGWGSSKMGCQVRY